MAEECTDLKRSLMEAELPGREGGRIRLADFYSIQSRWVFAEKVDYLRDIGALDEANKSQPLVIIPNYVLSYPNCMKATSLYSVCCHNECEQIFDVLEREIAAPMASPDRIVNVVESLSSSTVIAPRELAETLLNRLQEVAQQHGGKVQLHSRLFAQWMHHAYPRECPYPHEAGTTNPLTAEEWMKANGQKSEKASKDEMQKVVEESCPISEHEQGELPWTHVDERLVSQAPRPSKGRLCFLGICTIGTWGGLLYPWLPYLHGRAGYRPRASKAFLMTVLMVGLLSLAAFAFGLLSGGTFVLELVVLLALWVAQRVLPGQPHAKADRSTVLDHALDRV